MRELYRAWTYFCLNDIENVSKLLRMCRLGGVVGEKDSSLLRSSNSSLERLTLLKLCVVRTAVESAGGLGIKNGLQLYFSLVLGLSR